jgi:hypothetical protein
MSKTNELDLVVKELRKAAKSLNAAADSLAAIACGEIEPAPEPQPETLEPSPVALEEVRAVLAEKSRAGHTAEVRLLLEKHGATKLSEINPVEYAALLLEAEVL